MEKRTQKFRSIPLLFFQRFDHGAALKIERKGLFIQNATAASLFYLDLSRGRVLYKQTLKCRI